MLSVEFMLRDRPFRLFVFHILLAVPFVILSAYVSTIKPTGVKTGSGRVGGGGGGGGGSGS